MRILVVEDDQRIAKALSRALQAQNYIIDLAFDGEAGWDFVQAFEYDLIVLDVMLPKLNGINLCQRLRQAGYTMPVLMLTAKDTSNDKVIGLDVGADDYVVKPFDLPELAARIRALLRRGNSILPPVLEWEKLRLNPNTCEVSYNQIPLHFTPKEYSLLELFLHNPQRVFSRSNILEHLWSFEDPPSEEAVKVHIKDIRRKLKNLGAPPDLIETVYGIGYRLKRS
ncbi:response regulator transcription factor [Limnoraphis robusta]|uniref:Response regulator transcription factor n=1 Tax=Limnoraphis robusta CCNP1315 TaxID=3110306 RepID=A0ABU5U1M6_9CYAN|nr:response regulator transcription factor [Limnoraphis robusta]MEA5495791.1 response regulator transcription factor [Limnoraphis robusta BA-68 BA1]MEA5521087.1 response regulator transcription factor [Limnoraphis robusta CCNP1315]MEA5543468.1 response regulator transcription factor [Limnoraphis robusta CCNP1324]